ncbi:MAG: NHL repeat-containing protein, partial [Chloroflexi bacterium]|nr:NHL repeat-containing protein [Chloroflexota bacterium]
MALKAVKVRGRVFSYSRTIGNVSVFRYPVDLALGEGNTIYVLNRGHDGDWIFGVNVINTDEGLLGKFGGNGEGDGQFVWPTALVVDSQGLAYVADEWLNRISVYDTTVEFNKQDIGERNFLRKWGTVGSGDGQINGPAGMVLDRDENLYITEYVNHRVSKFTRGGEFLMSFGREGSGPGEYRDVALGVAVRSDGRVVMRDPRNGRLNVYAPDGTPTDHWPVASGLFRANAMVLDHRDHMYLKILLGR